MVQVETPNGEKNRLTRDDRGVHNWYRFVLSFPPHLVREYIDRFGLRSDDCVLDPFAGTGTTLVECKKQGLRSIGVEANPMAHFACRVKLDWRPTPPSLRDYALRTAASALTAMDSRADSDEPRLTLPLESMKLLLTDSISPEPLHRVLVLRRQIQQTPGSGLTPYALLALAKTAVSTASNLRFGPEVGVGAIKADAPVLSAWLEAMLSMAEDLAYLSDRSDIPSTVFHSDARQAHHLIEPGSISAVFTSPPYPNEKDYTRTTRLETVLLGFAKDRKELQSIKRKLLRSNTRSVYRDDDDDRWVERFPVIQGIAQEIEQRRIEQGKTSGFERAYARVAKLYFGGMARHLASLRPLLKPGAHLAYVVGDQASYLQVMIRTGQVLAEIAQSLGYELESIDLFRTRTATATRVQLREEVVVLRWPGSIVSAPGRAASAPAARRLSLQGTAAESSSAGCGVLA